MTAWSGGFLTPEQADETVRLAKEANLNALFIQVRKVGDAYYRSNYEPRAANIGGPADYDPLAYVIEKAHACGIEVHAWVNTFRVLAGSGSPGPGHIAVRYPAWLTRTSSGVKRSADGLFLDPGVSVVQDYTFNISMDVVRNYDIDGIHLDYVRYPGPDFGYAPDAVARFNEERGRTGVPRKGDAQWQQWRRDQVTALVRRIYRAATRLKPGIKVTAATISWGDCNGDFRDTTPFTRVFQDWRRWMHDGILDAAIPMNYKDERSKRSAARYRNWLDGFARWHYGRHIYGGLDFNAEPSLVVRQLAACRNRGLSGMVGFGFNESPRRTSLVQALKSGVYAQSAEIPVMPWKAEAASRAQRSAEEGSGVGASGPPAVPGDEEAGQP